MADEEQEEGNSSLFKVLKDVQETKILEEAREERALQLDG